MLVYLTDCVRSINRKSRIAQRYQHVAARVGMDMAQLSQAVIGAVIIPQIQQKTVESA